MAYGVETRSTIATEPAADELVQLIEHRTGFQISQLDVDCQFGRIIVTGCCPSYYVKQLVTQAVRSAEPRLLLRNELVVEA